MRKTKDNYTKQERQEYNRHYYSNNVERMQEQRSNPLVIQRRKVVRIRNRYQLRIAALLEKMANEISQVQTVDAAESIVESSDDSL